MHTLEMTGCLRHGDLCKPVLRTMLNLIVYHNKCTNFAGGDSTFPVGIPPGEMPTGWLKKSKLLILESMKLMLAKHELVSQNLPKTS